MTPVKHPAGSPFPTVPANFLALSPQLSNLESATVVLLPIPYDSTTSYKAGTRHGPRAIITASQQLEDYDLELGCEPGQVGIHTAPELEPHLGSPEAMVSRVAEAVSFYLDREKLVGLLGGEHSITVGAVRATHRRYPDLSVLFLDAHADLRDSYRETSFSHASVARRLVETCPVTEVGVRSISTEERQFLQEAKGPIIFYYRGERGEDWSKVVDLLSERVYISVDLDVFDPSIMAAVGTPEPGGMSWREVLTILRTVARERRIVGFDVTELSPGEGPEACAYTAAQLVHKLIGYATTPSNSWI